jgi:hypothetical protein
MREHYETYRITQPLNCKSAGYAFEGSNPSLPTTFFFKELWISQFRRHVQSIFALPFLCHFCGPIWQFREVIGAWRA